MVAFVDVIAGFAVLVVAGSVAAWLRSAHTRLTESREAARRAWSNVEVLIQRRYDEIGDLVDMLGERKAFEEDVLAGVVEAREAAIDAQTPTEVARAEIRIESALADVYSLREEYPDLRTNDDFDRLRDRISDLEQRLENRREYYNGAAAAYNARQEQFPERLFARLDGHRKRELFVSEPEAREGVDITERLRA